MPSNSPGGEGWEPWQALGQAGEDTHMGAGWGGGRTRLIQWGLGCVSSSLGSLASITVQVSGEHPEGPGAGQGWQKGYLLALGSDSFPDGLAVLQYLSQPVVCLMAQIAPMPYRGIFQKDTCVVLIIFTSFLY